ncbi:tail fiber protein [Escherichia coli]|nr:tail fiber protein [Escherichia coli]
MPSASLTAKGTVQLSSATNSESETEAATPKAVKALHDMLTSKYTGQDATTGRKGIVQLSSATNSNSETLAATPKAVKAAYDLANSKASAAHTHRWAQITDAPVFSSVARVIMGKQSIKDILDYFGLGEGSALPVGVPVPWPTATPPAGWLQCNGATFTKEQYPVLARVYPTLRLPDLRGEFIRGWDGGRKVDTGRALLSFQEGTIVSGFDDNDTGDISSLGSTQYGFGDALTSNQLGVINGKKWIFDASSKGAQRYDWWAYVSARPRNIAFNYIVRAA